MMIDRQFYFFFFQQIKIAVGEELLRTRNKREAPIDSDEDEDDIEEEIIEANEDEGERYIIALCLAIKFGQLKQYN